MKSAYNLLLVPSAMVVLLGFLAVCGRSATPIGGQGTPATPASSALTADECNFFQVDGKVRICHATGSGTFVIVQVNDNACVNGHTTHPADYIPTATDLDCHGGGCFPEGAPVDPTIPCCDGLVDENGVCSPPSCILADGGSGETADGGCAIP